VVTKRLFLFLSLIMSLGVYGHGGGLNAEGCHNERKTGGYHCHRSTSYNNTPQENPSIKPYNRGEFNYRSYSPTVAIGFYTGQRCSSINIDHIVSLKDAHESGAYNWSPRQKAIFGNDRDNHVPSCREINSSKGSAVPSDFLKRSRDGKGLDYKIIRFCDYVARYYSVKSKYGLSFAVNSNETFSDCGIKI